MIAHHAYKVALDGSGLEFVAFNALLFWYVGVAYMTKSVHLCDVGDGIGISNVSIPTL
jgi:hypothetical protein